MGIQRMDNVAVVVEDLDGAVDFFTNWAWSWKDEHP